LGTKDKNSNKVLEGHRLEASHLRQDLIWLYALFAAMGPAMADGALRGGIDDEGKEPLSFDPLAQVYTESFEPAVTRLLLQTAATLRVMDDHAGLDLGDPRYEVGQVQFDGGKAKPLVLRTACNKIIHLDRLEFGYVELESKDEGPTKVARRLKVAKQELVLHGTDVQGRAWRAEVLVPTYVRYGLLAAQLYGEAKTAAERQRLLESHQELFKWQAGKKVWHLFISDSLKDWKFHDSGSSKGS
jgi:hypothetical protein